MSKRISTGFNRLAPAYTLLAKIIFGNAIQQSQLHFLNYILPDDRMLILGGGSGDLLKAILKIHPAIRIDYIDISPKMLELARKKNPVPLNVNFIEGTEGNIPEVSYSVVITNFYLDLFPNETLTKVISKIKKSLRPSATWLVTDFVNEKTWHRIMLWIMYRFFRITTGIEAKRLPDWRVALLKSGVNEVDSVNYYGGFIKSSVYKIS